MGVTAPHGLPTACQIERVTCKKKSLIPTVSLTFEDMHRRQRIVVLEISTSCQITLPVVITIVTDDRRFRSGSSRLGVENGIDGDVSTVIHIPTTSILNS